MNTTEIVEALDAEIARLTKARDVLGDRAGVKRGAGKRRTMSPEGRANIVAAQRARWAKAKRGK